MPYDCFSRDTEIDSNYEEIQKRWHAFKPLKLHNTEKALTADEKVRVKSHKEHWDQFLTMDRISK